MNPPGLGALGATLLTPLGLLALLGIPILILLYLLKVRYRDEEVGSTYLWAQLARDVSAHQPWQKPRLSALLLIQIALVALLALALARPLATAVAGERHYAAIVLDGSASMLATDVAPSRFDAAVRLARDRIAALPEGSTGTLILAGPQPVVLAAEATQRNLIAALERARPVAAAGELEAALRLAIALTQTRPGGRVMVFSDGAFDPLTALAAPVPVTFQTVGAPGAANRAIVAIETRPEPHNRREQQTYLRVQNYDDAPTRATVALHADGALRDARSVDLEPGGAADLIFAGIPAEVQVVEARLAEPDVFVGDNAAWSVLGKRQPTRILVVTRGNLFLERAMTLLPDADVARIQPRRMPAVDLSQFDLLVLDGYIPDIPPLLPMLLVNPPDSPFLPGTGGVVRRLLAVDWDYDDPLLRFVDLSDVRVNRVPQLSLPGWAKVVARGADPTDPSGPAVPLLFYGEAHGRRVVAVAFDLQQSNLPLSASFPILVANAVGYLQPPRALESRSVVAGRAFVVSPNPQAERVELVAGEQILRAAAVAGATLDLEAPAATGVYGVRQLARDRLLGVEQFAVNLASAVESNVRPRVTDLGVTLAGPSPVPGAPAGRELWPYLLALAVAGLTLEWWYYHRKA